MRCRLVLLLLAVTGLAGCSFLPWYSYTNDVPSGASKVSIANVPWQTSAAKILVTHILCDPSRQADAQVVRAMLSPRAPALSCG